MINKTTKEIFEAQIKDGYCRRMDIVVHYLAIENHYGKNDFGMDLCLEVHKRRRRCHYNKSKRRIDGFKKLVSLVTKDTFDTNKHPLHINLQVMDIVQGAHRLALALYFGIDEVSVANVRKRKRRVDFGPKWFKKVEFDDDILTILENKKNYIVGEL